MIQYVKAKLYSAHDGSIKGNGIFLKHALSNNQAEFRFVWKETPGLQFRNCGSPSRSVNFGTFRIECEQIALRSVRIVAGQAWDSFETMLHGEELRTDSLLSGYKVIFGDEVYTPQNEVFSIDYDDLFLHEAREENSTNGLLIKSMYTSDVLYCGRHDYHFNQRHSRFNTPRENDRPYRIGVELELYARDQQSYNKITQARTNWFQCETDSSLTEHQFPIEMKTIPLRPVDATSIDFWSEPMKKLAQLAVSKSCSTTGLHVHISKEILGTTEVERQRNLEKLIWFYTYFIEDDPDAHRKNVIMCGRERGYHVDANGAKTELGDFAKEIGLTMVATKDAAFRKVVNGIKERCQAQRGDVNIKNWETYGTIEFRKGKGIISRTRMAAICTWWEQLCIYCKETPAREMNFDAFFTRVMRFPCVAHFFTQDEEC